MSCCISHLFVRLQIPQELRKEAFTEHGYAIKNFFYTYILDLLSSLAYDWQSCVLYPAGTLSIKVTLFIKKLMNQPQRVTFR